MIELGISRHSTNSNKDVIFVKEFTRNWLKIGETKSLGFKQGKIEVSNKIHINIVVEYAYKICNQTLHEFEINM